MLGWDLCDFFICAQNLGALSANMDNYNYIVPSVATLCSESEEDYCNPPVLAYDHRIPVNLTFSLLRTLVRTIGSWLSWF